MNEIFLNKYHDDIMMNLLDEKKVRELIINELIRYDKELVIEMIYYLNTLRILDKYIINSRQYTENPHSIKRIREEEILFIRKSYHVIKCQYKYNGVVNKLQQTEFNSSASKHKEIMKRIYIQFLENQILVQNS